MKVLFIFRVFQQKFESCFSLNILNIDQSRHMISCVLSKNSFQSGYDYDRLQSQGPGDTQFDVPMEKKLDN